MRKKSLPIPSLSISWKRILGITQVKHKSARDATLIAFFAIWIAMFVGCMNSKESKGKETGEKIEYVHDTITVMPEGEFVYNLPCKVVNIHQEKEGKSLLFIWLHGGVKDKKMHNLFEFNHLDCSAADDSVLNYLREKEIKSIALFPICHKAQNANCVTWIDCYNDVMKIIEDYVNKGVVDSKRIFLAGSSDGGMGTWDFLQKDESVYAAAMPMSCSNPKKTTVPVYFFNTQQEQNCSTQVESLNRHGCNIEYKHSPAPKHGGDEVECTSAFLDRFFSNTKK